jgi:hypothetical protein
MKRAALLILVSAVACDVVPPPASAPPAPALPWIRGFAPAAVSDLATPLATQHLARLTSASPEDDYNALELHADLAGDAQTETVLASYGFGVAIFDGTGHVVARAPGLATSGSADDLLAIAVGDAQLGAPVLVVASQRGGHRESTVSVTLYRMTGQRALQPLFSAPIEIHDGDVTRAGTLVFGRGQLWYRAPDATAASLWTLDPALDRYKR